MTDNVFERFQQTGEDLAWNRLTTTHGGNMSLRHQGRMAITTHFSMPGRLLPGNVVEIPLREEPDRFASDASWDAPLHQLIYKFTPAGAIIHAHPAYAVAISLRCDIVTPIDTEGSVLLREVAVVAPEDASSRLPQVLQTTVVAIVRGHGSYAVGRTLNEALAFTAAMEFSCKVLMLSARHQAKIDRRPAGS